MFQNSWITKQKVSASDINRIKQYLQEIRNENSSRVGESVQQLISFFLGSPNTNGILYEFGNEFNNYEPIEWASQLEKLLEHILPDSPVFTQIVKKNKDSNSQIILSNEFLPNYLEQSTYDNIRLTNIRKTHIGLTLQPLDGFYMALAYAIYNSEPAFESISQCDHLILDDFFTSLSRNPLLILLKKHLEYFSIKDRSIAQKIIYMLRIYLYDEILIKFEIDHNKSELNSSGSKNLSQSENEILSFARSNSKKFNNLKYRAKPHHFHALYLVLKFTPELFSNDFTKYSQAIIEHFSLIRSDQFCLQSFIRLWIFGMTLKNTQNIENEVIQALQNANSREGWFFLKRYSPMLIFSSENINLLSIQTALNILKLLEKESNWIANTSYLWTFACFFKFLSNSKIMYQDFGNCIRSMTNEQKSNHIIEKVFKLIIVKYNNSIIEILTKIKSNHSNSLKECYETISTYQSIISEYYLEYFFSKTQTFNNTQVTKTNFTLPSEFIFKQIPYEGLDNLKETTNTVPLDTIEKIASQNKQKLIAFYRRQPKGCWERPIDYNESSILFYLWLTVAKIIDFIIPGKRDQPCLNIRFLANPIIMLIVLIIFVIGWWIL